MRCNLHLAYWSLLSVTCISSCLLFLLVTVENAKYVAASRATATAATPTVAPATDQLTSEMQQEVLRNYKKVKKMTSNLEKIKTRRTEPGATTSASFIERCNSVGRKQLRVKGTTISQGAPDLKFQQQQKQSINGENEVPVTPKQKEYSADHLEQEQNKAQASLAASGSGAQSLPVITDIPGITVAELPLEVLEPTRGSLDALIVDAASEASSQESENRTVEILENSNEAMQKDEQIIKINDSGGGLAFSDDKASDIPSSAEHIPIENSSSNDTTTPAGTPSNATPSSVQQNASSSSASEVSGSGTVNLTAEEVPIPVFSEWAQKQMEAAEKQQAKEQEVVNTSTQKKNHTNGGGKPPPLKMRTKNYASPDCGAKIIASNADATNTGAVLSSSKDEYMLSPCGNRIWFVVELCEAIQAQKIELANFELFSSSPKNFTVAVSNRFPTRDWSNVGRFIAEDKRNVQSFTLHPHLFGKFVRVDIHSHYSKEHFCPVSLFRVFGTSEFEAFETENQGDLDDFDDEFTQEQVNAKNNEPNLFKSASDAVLSIVKKAAEVLVKPTSNQNATLASKTQDLSCRTPAAGQFSCPDCNRSLVERINNALSCEIQQLTTLLDVSRLRNDLLRTQVCAKQFGLETQTPAPSEDDCTQQQLRQPFLMDIKHSYFLNILPQEYIGALCQLLAKTNTSSQKSQHNRTSGASEDHDNTGDLALNLTIDKKLKDSDFDLINSPKKLIKPLPTIRTPTESTEAPSTETIDPKPATTTERSISEDNQLQRPPQAEVVEETTTASPEPPKEEAAPDVNIFNVPPEQQLLKTEVETPENIHMESSEEATTTSAPPTTTTETPSSTSTEATPAATVASSSTNGQVPAARSEEDSNTWENIDCLLSTTATPPPDTVANSQLESAAAAATTGVNLQQKIPSGPQSESVFMRLSNRIKALERNMSLSGQYLEELSRRYKKQVEELQVTLTQQMQTVRALEEQNQRHNELEQLLAQRNAQLKEELDDLSLQVHACIAVIIFVGAFVFLALLTSILFYRSLRRKTREVLELHSNGNKRKAANAVAAMQKKLNRRKSFEDFSDHQQVLSTNADKMRRPSEEALLILKEGNYVGSENVGDAAATKNLSQRERKISICYVNGQNGGGNANKNTQSLRVSGPHRRKGEKHSWPNTEQTQNQARKHLEELQTDDTGGNRGIEQQHANDENLRGGGKGRKKCHNLKRQESAPSEYSASAAHDCYPRLNVTAPAEMPIEYDESLLLDEEGLDNFIPTSDLAYNEFMPEGPSGYQVDGVASSNERVKSAARLDVRKAAGFFKSPFNKSLKLKSSSTGKSKHPHEPTSWEWYRSKKSEQKQLNPSVSADSGLLRSSPTASLDSSSLSEIHFPTSSTENSFRMLEEAILTSGEGAATNGNGHGQITNNKQYNHNNHNSNSSGASSSNRSSTSSTAAAKKKNRGFNKIFRKVF